jgi:tetratricopeptide (TPR) repeat protein
VLRFVAPLLAGAALLPLSPALAADALKFGPPPTWVVPQPIPPASDKASTAPVRILLNDVQTMFGPGKTISYSETAIRLQTPEGLSAGNVAIPWQPSTDTITINKLHIIRGGRVIDVLASGQTFTVARRETNLDAATLDGTLTAVLQPEDLQAGDIIDLAATKEHVDPVLKNHVEESFGAWNLMPFEAAHVRLSWPATLPLQTRQSPSLPKPALSSAGGIKTLELSAREVEPLIPPKEAPLRYRIGRFGEATDFASWADLSDLMRPLYRDSAVIPAAGPLHDEVEKIRASSKDPEAQAEAALALVQDRVRYVALLMGTGGYLPASAEQSWSRRFADCKGKTALLLAILHSLGIAAEPVLVHHSEGDAIADRLPLLSYFDHVLVRAHVAGKDYWLDGTRTGDKSLDKIDVPDFGWGLPLTERAQLVHIIPSPLDSPETDTRVAIDASKGVHAPAGFDVDEVLRGDAAITLNRVLSAVTDEQRTEFFKAFWVKEFDFVTPGPTSMSFDSSGKAMRLTMHGQGTLDWTTGYFHVPNSSLGYKPDFDRPAGPLHDVPVAIAYPEFNHNLTTIRFPPGFFGSRKQGMAPTTDEVLAGVDYRMSSTTVASPTADTLTLDWSERSLAPEVPYKDALAAVPRLRELDDQDVAIPLPSSYRATAADLAALKQQTPNTAHEFFVRAGAEIDNGQQAAALADLGTGLGLDPRNVWALRARAQINVARQDFAGAEKDLRAAAAIAPSDTDVAADLGALASERGAFGDASKAFDETLQTDPTSRAAGLGRAVTLMREGKNKEALAAISAVLAANPTFGQALALRAMLLYDRGDDAGADRDMAAALAADPENAAVLAARAQLAIGRKDFQTASEFISRSLAADPNYTFARGLQVSLLQRSENGAAVMASFDNAVANDPHDPGPLINRALGYAEIKRFDAAKADIESALSIDPDNVRALQAKADIASRKGDYGESVNALTAVLMKLPANGPALAQRAEAYRRLHKFDLAFADTNAAMKVGLVSPELRLQRINILIGKGDVAATAYEADQLTNENPTSDFAFVAAGKTYAAIGMRQKAIASFDRAIALNPQAYVYLNREQSRPFSDLEGKLADLDQALKLEPDQDDALGEKARLLSRAGNQTEAIALYDHAIKVALNSFGFELGRAVALKRADRSAESKAAFDAVYAKAKTASDFRRICSAKALNDVLLESAVHDCSQALKLEPDDSDVHAAFGMLQLKLGRLHDALAHYDRAVTASGDAEAYIGRAIVKSRLGDIAGAQADAAEAHRRRADIDDTVADWGLKYDGGAAANAR